MECWRLNITKGGERERERAEVGDSYRRFAEKRRRESATWAVRPDTAPTDFSLGLAGISTYFYAEGKKVIERNRKSSTERKHTEEPDSGRSSRWHS